MALKGMILYPCAAGVSVTSYIIYIGLGFIRKDYHNFYWVLLTVFDVVATGGVWLSVAGPFLGDRLRACRIRADGLRGGLIRSGCRLWCGA